MKEFFMTSFGVMWIGTLLTLGVESALGLLSIFERCFKCAIRKSRNWWKVLSQKMGQGTE